MPLAKRLGRVIYCANPRQISRRATLKNAFDKTYFTSLWNSANGGYAGVLGTPRTLGVTARYDF
ncbi:hypothetical protein AAA522_03455 [Pseudomonas aeruginosa]